MTLLVIEKLLFIAKFHLSPTALSLMLRIDEELLLMQTPFLQ